ncbi:MAG: hypothetical protein RR744_09650, partial [Cellulosilyticaceae bacterium]
MFNRSKTSNSNNIVYIDIDDTICDTRKALGNIYKRVTGEDFVGINSRDYEDMFPLWHQEDEVTKLFRYGKDIYNEAQPVLGAKEGVAKLLKKG